MGGKIDENSFFWERKMWFGVVWGGVGCLVV